MTKLIDLTNQTFGRWTVLHRDAERAAVAWVCRCDCGTVKSVSGSSLRLNSKSCGCLRREIGVARGKASRKHGMERSPEYAAYHQAKHRCTNPNSDVWNDYGGRGIEMRFTSFEHFYKELGPRPNTAYSLDRIDNEGHYEEGNCRWATRKTQNNNQRKRGPRRQHLLTIGGRTMNTQAWATEAGISANTITKRLRRGWSPERSVGLE